MLCSITVHRYAQRTAASCELSCAVFSPPHSAALPLPPCQFPTKSCHSAAASNTEPEKSASRSITAPYYNPHYICKGEIKASLASVLAERGDILWHV